MPKDKKRAVFITGITGLVGSYLAKLLLENGHKVYGIARPKDKQSPRQRTEAILNFWDSQLLKKHSQQLVVFSGDITQKGLGLDPLSLKTLQEYTEEIFHCAAITKFNLPLEVIRKPNVEGTKNLLELSLTFKNLFKINHISTAYVCGNYRGSFKEEDLELGQGFDTTYEQSKFEAEKLLQQYRNNGLWIDVFRPPLIFGESSSGKSPFFNIAVYQILHLWSLEIFDAFPVKGVFANLVCVDTLAQAIYTISLNASLKNKNYHPFSAKTISLEYILNLTAEIAKFKKPKPSSLEEFKNIPLSPAQKMLLAHNLFIFNPAVSLDSSFTIKTLKEYGFNLSPVNKKNLITILRYPFKVKFKNEELLP